MNFKKSYLCLTKSFFVQSEFELVPIRYEDKEAIRIWRNEQVEILRQSNELTAEEQTNYFNNVISKLFIENQPKQLLFSFLQNGQLIGYGGLVHIDWINKNAEISFLTPKNRSDNEKLFESDWVNFLSLIKKVAIQLNLVKIFTYAYSIRTNLFPILEKCNFIKEAVLKNHVVINAEKHHVFYHSYFCDELIFRKADETDLHVYYNWANDLEVRKNSFNTDEISLENHTNWFLKKIKDEKTFMYIFTNSKSEIVGQARIEINENENIIGVSVGSSQRGKGYATRIISIASKEFVKQTNQSITAYIKTFNLASIIAFESAGFKNKQEVLVKNIKSVKLTFI